MTGAIKRRDVGPPTQGSTPPNDDDPIHPDQHGDVPPNDDDDMLKVMNLKILWMMTNDLITILDQVQMTLLMMIKSTSFQMNMDHHLMIWICQEFRTRGKHIPQVHHQLRFLILTFQSKSLLILDKMTILHQDLIQLLSQGNRDRSQLILVMLYEGQKPRWLSRGQRFNYQVMSNLFQFLLRNMMMKKMKDLHMILAPLNSIAGYYPHIVCAR